MAKIPTNTTIDYDLKMAGVSEHIPFNEALELGLKMLLFEKGAMDCPDCKLLRNIANLQEEYAKLVDKLEDLEPSEKISTADGSDYPTEPLELSEEEKEALC